MSPSEGWGLRPPALHSYGLRSLPAQGHQKSRPRRSDPAGLFLLSRQCDNRRMNRPRVILLAILALAACGPPRDDADVEAQPEARAAASADEAERPVEAPLVSLVGEYRVAGIDGEALDAPTGIAVSIDPETIELAPCAGMVWNYTYADGMIATRRTPYLDSAIMCRIGPETAAVGAAIDVADSVRRTAANGIELAGGGHSVLLFSQ